MPISGDPSNIKTGTGLSGSDSVSGYSLTKDLIPDEVLKGIIQGTGKVLPASKVSTTGSGGKFFTTNAQGNLTELSFLLPQPSSKVGEDLGPNSGVPDWGILKLNDAGLVERGIISSTNSSEDIYPYYWTSPEVAEDLPLPGNDPSTDPVFNIDPSPTPDPTYTGGGNGTSHEGGFSRSGDVIQTIRVLPPTGGSTVYSVVSGIVFPADRGVLSLIHWPAGGLVADFLAQPLEDRCVAALRLGQGIDGTTPTNCDGDPGGIFSIGPGFPGREEGQLNLSEIHAGINSQTGDPLPSGPLPSAGQVRLGTNPLAGPVIPGGIPIFGGTTVSTGGGNDNNFFRYRLPYLSNYESLLLTPEEERGRFFDKPPVSDDFLTPLTKAGNYNPFATNFANFQLGRFRHRFPLPETVGGPTEVVEQGTFLLIHFKKEENFESFVRDGIFPNDLSEGYEIWSVGLSNWDNPEEVSNVTDLGYSILRASIGNDPVVTLPTKVTAVFDFSADIDEVMWVSGVQYFITNSAVGQSFEIISSALEVGELFSNSFLLGNSSDPLEVSPGMNHRNPLFLYMGGFTADENISVPGVSSFSGTPLYQRVEFSYSDLGAFNLTSPPASSDLATISHNGGDPPLFTFGNNKFCHFWTDARLRAFGRKPPGHENVLGSGTEILFDRPGGKKILFHTTSHGPNFDAPGGIYGNFVVPPSNFPRPQLENSLKDVEEIFLDEVYRITEAEIPNLDPTFDGVKGNLTGPGIPFVPSPIELPVRFGSSLVGDFGFASYLQNLLHEVDLTGPSVNRELQVSGFPDRNPPLSEGVTNPVPFSGLLKYPKEDYSIGFRPSVVDGDTSNAQPDYSGVLNERMYYRVFDAAYSNDLSPEEGVIGQPFLWVRIDGLQLEDFAFIPPTPGSDKIAIQLKIPGLTSWMDLGRSDGDGPSKQDPFLDGAGCQVIGSETFNGVDPQTGVVYCVIKVHVGPAANVFGTSGLVSGVPDGIAPVLFRVTIRKVGDDLDFSQGGVNGSSSGVRGLTGIKILRFSEMNP